MRAAPDHPLERLQLAGALQPTAVPAGSSSPRTGPTISTLAGVRPGAASWILAGHRLSAGRCSLPLPAPRPADRQRAGSRSIETPVSALSGKGAFLRSILREQFQRHLRHSKDGWPKTDPADLDAIDKSHMLNKYRDHCGVNHCSIAIDLAELIICIRR